MIRLLFMAMLIMVTLVTRAVLSTFLEFNPHSVQETLPVFEKGNFTTISIRVNKSDLSPPPEPVLVTSPQQPGIYPILFFVHGTLISNGDYSDLFEHIASHGIIVVAPQLFSTVFQIPVLPSQSQEIEMAARVANWLPMNLNNILPTGISGNFAQISISGHSRGGKPAFALALAKSNTKLKLKIEALIAVDPVAGTSKNDRTEPRILTFLPNSIDLSTTRVSIIGTGLGNHSRFIVGGSCAPNDVNYAEFFNEIKEGSCFVVKDYGHTDMLNDNDGALAKIACVSGEGPYANMRRTVGGIVVAFLRSSLEGNDLQYSTLLADPQVAPVKLYPVQQKGVSAKFYAQD